MAESYPDLSNSTSVALEASRVVKAAPGKVFTMTVYNNKGAAQFIQFFNSTTVPADTAVPVFCISVPTVASVTVQFSDYGRTFSTGIAVSNSTTAPTKTIGAADCFFDVQFV